MSVRYDPLVTRLLAREIGDRWMATGVRSLGMSPDRSAASVRFADGSALVALLDRSAGFIYAADDDPLGDDGVRTTRFGRMSLAGVEAPPDERALVLRLAEDDGRVAAGIAIELHTNRWNVLALVPAREAPDRWRVRYALWTREVAGRRLGPGEPYEPPTSGRRGFDAGHDPGAFSDWLAEAIAEGPGEDDGSSGTGDGVGAGSLRTAVLETWAWTSALNVEWLLADPGAAATRHRELMAIAGEIDGAAPVPVFLGERRWGRQPYPLALGDQEAVPAPDLLTAMTTLVVEAGGAAVLLDGEADEAGGPDEADLLGKRLRSRRDREAKRVAALRRQLEAAGPPEAARELGQILLARKESVDRGVASVVLEGFDGKEREIALDPALDAIANAERFFEEARRRERVRERLPSEIAGGETRLTALDDALDRLERDGPSDELWRVAGGRPPKRRKGGRRRGRSGHKGEETRLPYTRLQSSGGLEIRVGRGPRDNDELTFRHSAPDDIWLHAAQTSGAHVVLKWGKRDANPPQRDLIEAAVAAAVNSGARHSGVVSVSWTRRKYVRKPRKAPPGTVTPDRVQTIAVEPDEALVSALREAAERL